MKNRFLLLLTGLVLGSTIFSLPPVHALVENQAFGIFGVAPVTTQPRSAAQAAVTVTSAQVSTAAASDLATAQALANALKTQGNALQVDVAALTVLANRLRTDLVSLGLIKGSN